MSSRPQDVLNKVLHLTTLLALDMARYEREAGLSGPRVQLLWALGISGPTTQQALASALSVTARNITGLVDGLVASNHVTREAHPTDRRATLVTPTKLGEQTIQELQDSHTALATDLFGSIPAPRLNKFEEALEQTIETFTRLMEES